ncbi:MAG: type II secretion system minor pseudopilin GspK [Mariprofundales bacterium]|nr:type II secretion system minor pseudopilin GspK [Mariprofundales bacterium]
MNGSGTGKFARDSERGVALILVLGLVALVAVWAAQSASEDQISLRRAENMQLATQAMLATESGFALGRKVLAADDASVDSLNDAWAQKAPPFPVPGGVVAGAIVDSNRYVNLNDMVDDHGKARPKSIAVVKRLFTQVGVDPALVDALVDWMDKDDHPYGAAGAEAFAYLNRPWRVKNAPLDSLRELLLVKGFDRSIVKQLRAVAVALPHRGVTAVNINTASKRVLMSLADSIPASDVDAMIVQRKSSPWLKVSDWSSQAPYAVWASHIPLSMVSTVSDRFIMISAAQFGRVRWEEKVLLQRVGKVVKIVKRWKVAGS